MKTIEPQNFPPGTPILDIREGRHSEQIRGALRYDPRKLLHADKLVLPLPKNGRIVLCANDANLAESVAARLRDNGYSESVLLEGGAEEWKEHGLPMESSTQEQPVPGEEDAGIGLI